MITLEDVEIGVIFVLLKSIADNLIKRWLEKRDERKKQGGQRPTRFMNIG